MPNYQQYLQPGYVSNELGRIIGTSLLPYVQDNPELILAPLRLGFFDGFELQKTDKLKIQIQLSDRGLADRVRIMVQGMFDFSQKVGKDLLEDKVNDELTGPEIAAFFETLMGHFVGYVSSPEWVYTFKKYNRRTQGLAHLLPPEENIN